MLGESMSDVEFVLPAFSLKFKIQEFKMAKNGHGGKRAGAGRPPLLPAKAKPERMKGAAGDITLSPARLLSTGRHRDRSLPS